MAKTAEDYIEKLKLKKHPEGGYFSEVYRSEDNIKKEALPDGFSGERSISTSIYFLLEKEELSHFHRIKSDELWHFYDGASVTIHIIDERGGYEKKILGRDIENDESFQIVAPKNCWFGAEVNDKTSYSLIGCTVAPGFDFDDFELAKREELLSRYPERAAIITALTEGL
jgi:uncharacterized protein